MDDFAAYRADGPSGELLAGYQVAGTFGRWRLTARNRQRWELTATDASLDDYYAYHSGVGLRVRLALGVPGGWEGDAEIVGTGPLVLRGRSVLGVTE